MKVKVWYTDGNVHSSMWDRIFWGVKSVTGLEGGMVEVKQEGKRQMLPQNNLKRLEIIEDA